MLNRRHLLGSTLAALPMLGVAATPAAGARRLVFVILRGGLDGLWAAPVPGDPDFAAARGSLADAAGPPLPLSGPFALHPLLTQMHAMYGRGELAVVHAVGLRYRERSHFDAQQVLESGGTQPYELPTGWLGRALPALGGARAVALDSAVPLVLRGPAAVDTWAPPVLAEPSADLGARLATTCAGAAAVALAARAADFLQQGANLAVLELSGWDSHVNQAAPRGALSNNLRTLDAMLGALREGLQPGGAWSRSAVLVATEFGRTVAPNGTQGTDHGSGGVAFVAGGAVKGGRVIADWPGLAARDRWQGRDLRTTCDLRSVQRTLLVDHLGLPRALLDACVLPGSAGLPRVDLLA
jgi:uncharacterized protein (DUF1501 family)